MERWMDEIRSWQASLREVVAQQQAGLAQQQAAVQELQQQTEELQGAYIEVDQKVENLQKKSDWDLDAQIYAERDGRRLLLGSAAFCAKLSEVGSAGIKAILMEWANSYRAQIDLQARDFTEEIKFCEVFRAEAFLGERVCLALSSKFARDTLCRQLAMSPARKASWPGVRVAARLTRLQEQNRKAVLGAFQVAGPGQEKSWLPGRSVMIEADTALIITSGQPVFRIALGLSPSTVAKLLDKALALQVVGGEDLPPPPVLSAPAGVARNTGIAPPATADLAAPSQSRAPQGPGNIIPASRVLRSTKGKGKAVQQGEEDAQMTS